MIKFKVLSVIVLTAASLCSAAEIKRVCEPNSVKETGPTLNLNYDDVNAVENPIYSFMYFVPLISPTLVQSQISPENTLKIKFTSYEMEKSRKSFKVVYKFDISGEGLYNNVFNPEQIIEWNTKHGVKKGRNLTKLLEYIKFEGEGCGRCEIKGSIKDGQMVVNRVRVHFYDKDCVSPVTVRIYDVTADANGDYNFESRFNKVVARVNTLTFERSKSGDDELPRMDIKLGCVSDDEDCAGFWSSVKGKFANLLIKPISVSRIGNDSMIDFGLAVAHKKGSYTFPVAENLVGGAPVVAMIPESDKKTQ